MSLKQSRKSISIPGKLYARALAHAQANGKPLAAIVTHLLDWHLSQCDDVPAPVIEVARKVAAKPARNPRGRNPDNVNPRTIHNGQARLATIKKVAREKLGAGPGPQDGRDVVGAMPARVRVPVAKGGVKW